eukprot:8418009-Alexandrium_andersonii.AAC.1
MSASLVGSEMCIRDRARAGGARAVPGPARSDSQAGSGAGVIRKPGMPAVSYTHLTLPTICSV